MWTFVYRFVWGVAAFAVLMAVIILTAMILDGCNVVRRSMDILAPHEKSLRLMIRLCAVWLLLCIPGITQFIAKLAEKLKRLEVGGVTVYFEQGKFDDKQYNECFSGDGKESVRPWSVLKLTKRDIECEILRRHSRRLNAEIKYFPARLKGDGRQFDALFLKGKDIILVEAKITPKGEINQDVRDAVVRRFEEAMLRIESSDRDYYSLDLLVAVPPNTPCAKTSPFEPIVINGKTIGRVFYYPVNFILNEHDHK